LGFRYNLNYDCNYKDPPKFITNIALHLTPHALF